VERAYTILAGEEIHDEGILAAIDREANIQPFRVRGETRSRHLLVGRGPGVARNIRVVSWRIDEAAPAAASISGV